MPTQVYRTHDGQRVPSVTTICNRFKESGGLIHWSNRIAYEPLMQARALLKLWQAGETFDGPAKAFLEIPDSTFDYSQARDRAADAGTIAHDMVDSYIHGRPFDVAKYARDLVAMAEPAFFAFREWADQSKLQVVETEKPLVSEEYRFGGTRDSILLNGRRALGDWKSSNSIYAEYLLQLAAYGILDEEHGETIDGGYHLCRFSKQEKPTDPVQFTHHYWSHLDTAKRGFVLLREAYDVMKDLEKLVK
jgi:hypothetical protein